MKWTARSLGLLGTIGVVAAAIGATYTAGTELAFGNGNDLDATLWFTITAAVLVVSMISSVVGDYLWFRPWGGEEAVSVMAGPETTHHHHYPEGTMEYVVPPGQLTIVSNEEDGMVRARTDYESEATVI